MKKTVKKSEKTSERPGPSSGRSTGRAKEAAVEAPKAHGGDGAGELAVLVKETMGGIGRSIEAVSLANRELHGVIHKLSRIAFQMNLMALNAEMKAGREGAPAGSGLAMVAEDIRDLAVCATDAVTNLTARVEGAVRETRGGSRLAEELSRFLGKRPSEGVTAGRKAATKVQ